MMKEKDPDAGSEPENNLEPSCFCKEWTKF